MIKPIKSVFFLSAVLGMLAFISAVFPENGIELGKEVKLKFPSLKSVLFPEKVEYADISKIINDKESLDLKLNLDSLAKIDTILADISALEKNLHAIEFPDNNKTVLYSFFAKLRNLKKSGDLLRIFHFGDSQIEGDRITSYMRFHLQRQFGGSGPGLIAVTEPASNISINRTSSPNWCRYTVFGSGRLPVNHNKYGFSGSFSRFSPAMIKDSLKRDSLYYEGWVKLGRSGLIDQNTQNYSQVKVLYGNTKSPVSCSFYTGKEVLFETDTIFPRPGFGILKESFQTTPDMLMIRFGANESPDIYGIMLDAKSGIAVDNIPQRGSCGLDFTKMNQDYLKAMINSLNVKLLILEFGVNVVPNVVDDYGWYEKLYYNNLVALKKLDPELSIIVIGVSDMSLNEGGNYVSYPNITKIRDAQKRAAFMAGCAFWDLYEAMGGNNSMPSWVQADPPLAQKDFTHFNPAGAKFIAEMFYKAFIYEYYQYLSQNLPGKNNEMSPDSNRPVTDSRTKTNSIRYRTAN